MKKRRCRIARTLTLFGEHGGAPRGRPNRFGRRLAFESLEGRRLLTSYSVDQIRAAYGINSIPNFGSTTADGSGQTIAIVDYDNDADIFSDLDGFDNGMYLTTGASQTLNQLYGPASSFLTVYNQAGTNITSLIATSSGSNGVPIAGNQAEITLDVEWAHAIAPGAKIDLIETDSSTSNLGLFAGAAIAATLPGVSVVSMSWIETPQPSLDATTFVTPLGHPGVTFVASSGDNGNPSSYPAGSPNVVSVGGTSLYLNGDTYDSETGWSFSTPRSLDNGSNAYIQIGNWTSTSGGYSGSYSEAPANSASTAEWTTTILPTDRGWLQQDTEVSATWVANSGNATNATYRIYDGTAATGTLLDTVVVNQTQPPVGTPDGSTQFQELGDYYSTTGKLTVVLNTSTANGTVDADAIGIAPGFASSGGQNQFETEPSYQSPFQSTGYRTTPDVSFDGANNTGVTTYYDGSWYNGAFGTSLSAPCWAGLIAIANQGRVAAGGPTLNSSTNPQQTLQALYHLPASDFHDITSGYNGNNAVAGYDEVTGRGTPIANTLVPDLASFELPPAVMVSDNGGAYNGTTYPATATVDGAASLEGVSPSLTYYLGSTVTGNPLTAAPINAGTYTVVASYAGSTDYPAAQSKSLTFTIGQAPLTVAANNAARLVGAADPPFTATISGFANGETLLTSGMTGSPSLTSSDAASSPVGTYTIAVALGTLAAANYDFAVFHPGTLTVSASLVLHTPSVTNTTTAENTQSMTGLIITPNNADTSIANDFQITNITGGTLFLQDGVTPITNGQFITAAQALLGLKFTPANNALAPGSFTAQASANGTATGLGGTPVTATITITPAPFPWHNYILPCDVNGDGIVAPIDVLTVINELNSRTVSNQSGRLPSIRPANDTNTLFDVTADGFVTPLDALTIINYLNASKTGTSNSNATPAIQAILSNRVLSPTFLTLPNIPNLSTAKPPARSTTALESALDDIAPAVARTTATIIGPMRP